PHADFEFRVLVRRADPGKLQLPDHQHLAQQRAVLRLRQQYARHRPALHPTPDGLPDHGARGLRSVFGAGTEYHAAGRARIDYFAAAPLETPETSLVSRGAVSTISTGSRLARTSCGPSNSISASAPRWVSTRWNWSNTRLPSE